MKARAPGKVVISGAYAVLEGAPALVAAVDRYVTADGSVRSERVTDEVAQAIRGQHLEFAPWFDASALRSGRGQASEPDRKLGLGSSAAILVASLGAAFLHRGVSPELLAEAVFPVAWQAHRAAQGGGSGVDVAASCWGGVLRCELAPEASELRQRAHALPAGLIIEVFASRTAASTVALLSELGRFRAARPAQYRALIDRAGDLASRAADCTDPARFIALLDDQYDALGALGTAAGIPIVTDAVAELRRVARDEGACFGPSGAGGGDVALFMGSKPSSPRFRARVDGVGLCLLDLRVGAEGLQPVA